MHAERNRTREVATFATDSSTGSPRGLSLTPPVRPEISAHRLAVFCPMAGPFREGRTL